jgi:hypothetical protein
VPDPSAFDLEVVTEKLKRHKSRSTERQENSLKQWVEEFANICKLINSVWNKEDLPEQWKESVIVRFL